MDIVNYSINCVIHFWNFHLAYLKYSFGNLGDFVIRFNSFFIDGEIRKAYIY